MSEQAIRLTQYSHGAGCGCKISHQRYFRYGRQTDYGNCYSGLAAG